MIQVFVDSSNVMRHIYVLSSFDNDASPERMGTIVPMGGTRFFMVALSKGIDAGM
jgi:hypothetical protein